MMTKKQRNLKAIKKRKKVGMLNFLLFKIPKRWPCATWC